MVKYRKLTKFNNILMKRKLRWKVPAEWTGRETLDVYNDLIGKKKR